MTRLVLLTLVLAAPFAYSQETYIRDGFMGEYPLNFEVTKTVKVAARYSPQVQSDRFGTCTLQKGAKYGHLSKNKDADYFTKGYVTPYKAIKDLDLADFTGDEKLKGQKIQTGEQVDEVVYGSEGFCLVRFKGKFYDATCPSLYEENFTSVEPNVSPDRRDEEWLQLRCNGYSQRLWILIKDLEPLFEKGTLKIGEQLG